MSRRFENDISATVEATPVVCVVDGDPAVRETLESLIRTGGWQPRMFASGRELLERPRELVPGCVILDARSPALGDLELRKLIVDRPEMPIICIASDGDVQLSVKTMKAGALEFMTKPFRTDLMLTAIVSAIEHSRVAVSCEVKLQELHARYASLTYRERQVLHLVEKGTLNKLIAFDLGISEITVKAHRANVMRKMRAQSLADLINMMITLAVSQGLIDAIPVDHSSATRSIATASFIRPMLMRLGLLPAPGVRLSIDPSFESIGF